MKNSLLGLACAVILLAPPAHGDDGGLVFGATRNTGLEIAKILAGRGEAVTAFVRPTSNLENLEPEPTGPVTRGDLADMVVWAYDNDESIRKIYHVVGDDPLAVERMDDPKQ